MDIHDDYWLHISGCTMKSRVMLTVGNRFEGSAWGSSEKMSSLLAYCIFTSFTPCFPPTSFSDQWPIAHGSSVWTLVRNYQADCSLLQLKDHIIFPLSLSALFLLLFFTIFILFLAVFTILLLLLRTCKVWNTSILPTTYIYHIDQIYDSSLILQGVQQYMTLL